MEQKRVAYYNGKRAYYLGIDSPLTVTVVMRQLYSSLTEDVDFNIHSVNSARYIAELYVTFNNEVAETMFLLMRDNNDRASV